MFQCHRGASHSALNDMKAITQEISKTITASEPKARDIDMDININYRNNDRFVNVDEFYTLLKLGDNDNTSSNKLRNDEVTIEELEPQRPTTNRKSNVKHSNDSETQKKFGSAKAISSDQFFQDSANDNSVFNYLSWIIFSI